MGKNFDKIAKNSSMWDQFCDYFNEKLLGVVSFDNLVGYDCAERWEVSDSNNPELVFLNNVENFYVRLEDGIEFEEKFGVVSEVSFYNEEGELNILERVVSKASNFIAKSRNAVTICVSFSMPLKAVLN